jgi:hypothetical protein
MYEGSSHVEVEHDQPLSTLPHRQPLDGGRHRLEDQAESADVQGRNGRGERRGKHGRGEMGCRRALDIEAIGGNPGTIQLSYGQGGELGTAAHQGEVGPILAKRPGEDLTEAVIGEPTQVSRGNTEAAQGPCGSEGTTPGQSYQGAVPSRNDVDQGLATDHDPRHG